MFRIAPFKGLAIIKSVADFSWHCMFGFDGHILTWHRLFLTIFRIFPVNHHSPTAPCSFIHYHRMDKTPIVATALQRHNSCSTGWRLSNQPNQLQYCAAGNWLLRDALHVSPHYVFVSATYWNNRSVCLSVYSYSVMTQHVKFIWVMKPCWLLKLPTFHGNFLYQICGSYQHIPDLNLHRHGR